MQDNYSLISKYLRERIDALKDIKGKSEIAAEIGYEGSGMIRMFKRGEARVPLDKVPVLARALNVDPARLFCLAVEQYWPGGSEAVARIFSYQGQPETGTPEAMTGRSGYES